MPKYGQDNVDRNRLKRRLREIVRQQVLRLLPPADVVIRAKPSAYSVSYDVLAGELMSAAEQIVVATRC